MNELLPVYKASLDIGGRIGQALEIATYRALCALPGADFSGRFRDLETQDDSTFYKKEKPPQHIGTRSLNGAERLDFILRLPPAGPLGMERKNVLRGANDFAEPEEKEQRIAEVSAARRVMQAVQVRVEPIVALLKSVVVQFSTKLKETLVGIAVNKTVGALSAIIGQVFKSLTGF